MTSKMNMPRNTTKELQSEKEVNPTLQPYNDPLLVLEAITCHRFGIDIDLFLHLENKIKLQHHSTITKLLPLLLSPFAIR